MGLPLASPWLGQKVKDLAFHAMGVRVVNLRRANGQPENVTDETELHPGDTLVLSGKSQTLAVAEEKLLRG
ncbi:MAG: Glutathione-regulated potassium-efflux system protein KefC [Pseudomonadota bacterium]